MFWSCEASLNVTFGCALRGEFADLPREDEIWDEFRRLAASEGMLLGDETKFDII